MRYPIIVTSLLLLCSIFLDSCQNEYEDPSDPSLIASDFRAKVSGSQFVANISSASKANSIISLTGRSSDGQMISFSVADSGARVYSLDIHNFSNVGSYQSTDGVNFFSNGGSTPEQSGGNLAIVSIDSVNRLMSGTFNLKVFHQPDSTQKVITEGIFKNISY